MRTASSAFGRSRTRPRRWPASRARALGSMGIYVFNARPMYELLCEDAAQPDSGHDFGKDVIPDMINSQPRVRLSFSRPQSQGDAVLARRRHARRLLSGEHGFGRNRSGAQSVRRRLADPHGVQPSCRRRRPCSSAEARPAKPAAAKRSTAWCAMAASSPAVTCSRSILSPNVRVNSYAIVEESILYDGVDVGRYCAHPAGDHRQGRAHSGSRHGRLRR